MYRYRTSTHDSVLCQDESDVYVCCSRYLTIPNVFFLLFYRFKNTRHIYMQRLILLINDLTTTCEKNGYLFNKRCENYMYICRYCNSLKIF